MDHLFIAQLAERWLHVFQKSFRCGERIQLKMLVCAISVWIRLWKLQTKSNEQMLLRTAPYDLKIHGFYPQSLALGCLSTFAY